jgi:hypothetical protein
VGSIQVVVLESNGFITRIIHGAGDQGWAGVQGPGSNTCLLEFGTKFVLYLGCAWDVQAVQCQITTSAWNAGPGVGNARRGIRAPGMRDVGKNVGVMRGTMGCVEVSVCGDATVRGMRWHGAARRNECCPNVVLYDAM